MRMKPKRVSCPTESEGSFMFRAKVKRMSATTCMQEPAKETLKIASLAEGHKTASKLVSHKYTMPFSLESTFEYVYDIRPLSS